MPFNLGYAASYKQPPKRCAIYARYSSRLQDVCSIVDQIRECREAIERMGWVVVEEFVCSDEATSGQSHVGRFGLDKLLQAAQLKQKPFDVIVIDDTSRFGRNLSLTLPITDQLAFDGVELYFAKQELGSWNPHFRDLFIKEQRQDEQFSVSIAQKVKRGQKGRVARGYIGTGRTYGYRNVPIEIPGTRGTYGRPKVDGVIMEKIPEETAVILRIFQDRAAGVSQLQIVHALNREGVPSTLASLGKGSRNWNVPTLTRLLDNEKYIGVYTFNKLRQARNPRTGRKSMVPRPIEDWQIEYRPELGFVSLDLWIAAHKEMALSTWKTNGPKNGGLNRTEATRTYIFSGLLKCGLCGGNIVITDSKTPHAKYGCHRHRAQGICSNRLSINRSTFESQLLAYLGENLKTPALKTRIVNEFSKQLKAAIAERAKAAKLLRDDSGEIERKRVELRRQITNAIDTAVAFGPTPELTARHEKLKQELAALQPPPVIRLPHESYTPNQISDFLETKLLDLGSVLAADPQLAKREMQKRITKLVLTPVETPEGSFYDVSGDLRLFGDLDGVMVHSFMYRSDDHYAFCTLPISIRLKTKPPRKRAA